MTPPSREAALAPCAESPSEHVGSPPLGGFFAWEAPRGEIGVLQSWCGTWPAARFLNARSALAALVRLERPSSVWLPAFLCDALAQAVPAPLRRYYPVDDSLSPRVSALAAVRSGDLLVGIDYFGCGPAEDFLAFVSGRPDVRFVEDCAHCLATDATAWGDWRLYSPRKLMGVADGGILVALRPGLAVPRPARRAVDPATQWLPALLRSEDPDGERASVWHGANQAKERAMIVGDEAMTEASQALLASLDPRPMIARRRANFDALDEALGRWALALPRKPFVPFAFPVRLDEDRRDAVLQRLHAEGIFAAVHWRDLPSPVDSFPEAHRFSRQTISLPCDHRYGPRDMARIAHAFRRAVA